MASGSPEPQPISQGKGRGRAMAGTLEEPSPAHGPPARKNYAEEPDGGIRGGGDPVSTPGSRRGSHGPWDGGRGLTGERGSGWDFPAPEVRRRRAHLALITASTCAGPAGPADRNGAHLFAPRTVSTSAPPRSTPESEGDPAGLRAPRRLGQGTGRAAREAVERKWRGPVPI